MPGCPTLPVVDELTQGMTQASRTLLTEFVMTSRRNLLIFFFLYLSTVGVTAQNLACGVDRNESLVASLAPEGSKRVTSQHALIFNYKLGGRRFVDKPPYDEELSGLH